MAPLLTHADPAVTPQAAGTCPLLDRWQTSPRAPRPTRSLAGTRRGRGTAPRSPGWVVLDCATALVALNVAFVALITFPIWLGLTFTAIAGLALFIAVREVLLWTQHLADLRATRR